MSAPEKPLVTEAIFVIISSDKGGRQSLVCMRMMSLRSFSSAIANGHRSSPIHGYPPTGQREHEFAVESARATQCRINRVDPIRGAYHDDFAAIV